MDRSRHQCHLWLEREQLDWMDRESRALSLSRSGFMRQYIARLMQQQQDSTLRSASS